MDLSPDYDAPVTIKLASVAHQAAVADLTAKQAARDLARNTSTDPQVKEAALQAWQDAKAVYDGLGNAAFAVIEFPRMEWVQIKAIGAKLKAFASASIHARADETRLPTWERFRALQEHDAVGKTIPDIVRFAKTDDGVDEILNQQAPKAVVVHPDGSRTPLPPEDVGKVMKAIGPLGRAGLAVELVSAADPKMPTPATNAPARPNQ